MRIVIATPFFPPQIGTLGTYAEGIEKALKHAGHDVVVVSGGAWQRWPAGVRHIIYFLKVLIALRGATFVLALDTWSVGLPAYYAARLFRVPFTVRIGGDLVWESYVERRRELIRLSDFYTSRRAFSLKERLMRSFVHQMTAHARVLFFNTRFQEDIWEKEYAFVHSRATVLENYYPPHAAATPSESRVFVAAVRGVLTKNPGVLARAFARVQKKHPNISLETKLMPHRAQLERLKNAYAVIIPAISEVSSNMAAEAVSFGRPFIAPEDTGLKERLSECGLFVDTLSEDALVFAIERLLDPIEYENIAARAATFSFVRTWDDIARDIVQGVAMV